MGGPSKRRRGPTIVDVARHAGVSTAAVSFALNGRPGVAERDARPDPRRRTELGLGAERQRPLARWPPRARDRPGDRPRPAGAGRRPVLHGLHRGRRARARRTQPGAAAAGRRRRLDGEADRYRHLARSRARRRRLPHRPALRRPADRAPRRSSGSRPSRSIAPTSRARSPRSARTTARASRTPSATWPARPRAHRLRRRPPDLLHGAHRLAVWSRTMAELGLAADLVAVADFTAAAGAHGHARAADRRRRSPDGDRLRERLDGHRRPHGRTRAGLRPAARPVPRGLRGLRARRPRLPIADIRPLRPCAWGRTATRVLLDAIEGRPADVELEPARLVVRASTQERRPS